jgi:hydroxymethylbilane synthase
MGCSVPNGILYNPETEFLYMDINIRENVISIRIKVRTLQEAEMVARNVKEIMNYGDY